MCFCVYCSYITLCSTIVNLSSNVSVERSQVHGLKGHWLNAITLVMQQYIDR